MTTPVIIDAIVVVILVVFTYLGARRGMLRTLAGLMITMIALVGASMVATTFSGPVSALVSPLVEERLSEKVMDTINTWVSEQPGATQNQEFEMSVGELLNRFGLDENMQEALAQKVEDAVRESGATVVTAVVQSLVHSFVYGVVFILAFLALLLLLKVLLSAMNLLTKLPGVHGLNAFGGGVLGLMEGALLLFLLVWAARQLGVNFNTSEFAQTHILRVFTDNTPLGLLSRLQ